MKTCIPAQLFPTLEHARCFCVELDDQNIILYFFIANPSSSNLSGGAVAGIIIAVLVVLGAGAAAAVLIKRRNGGVRDANGSESQGLGFENALYSKTHQSVNIDPRSSNGTVMTSGLPGEDDA